MYFICHTAGGASPAVAVVKTIPVPPEQPVITSSATVPQLKPVQTGTARAVSTITSTSSSPKDSAFSLQTASQSATMVVTLSPPSSSSNPPSAPSGEDVQKISTTIPFSSTGKAAPPFVAPKPQSPVNVVTPMTQTAPISPPPPLVTPPLTPTKPAMASVPSYAPVSAATARVAPTPVSFSPQVLQASSLSPIGEGASTPSRGTPSGRSTPSTALRQGIPQKPYTFLEEKAR